ncbi:transposase [Oceanivirga miroungae]|uniref:Transposase IS3/IS911 family protein n=1 Tax=Oceanivirga miroungae TaxID=1130046 RepID=A0A6I8MBW9_9FUSO|nr:transposase [Oceanivirga miroungae]VWL84927.1 transposase IS3/IS911 family protein [Oceanivirga miroungae]VWL84959.1 transposase IS3/IS911 family protein [Oceanivirga miroungae]
MGRKAKLSKEEKIQLCKDREKGMKLSELAIKYDVNSTTVKQCINLYKKHGCSVFEEKVRNSTYTKEFKQKILCEYLSGKSKNEIIIEYNINKTVLNNCIKLYNSNKELTDYDPKGEFYTMKSKKYTKQEKYNITKECIENNKNYKEICKKYYVSYPTIYRWVNNFEKSLEDKLKDNNTSVEAKHEILLKLKDIEIERLKAELEILKKNEEIMDELEKMGR